MLAGFNALAASAAGYNISRQKETNAQPFALHPPAITTTTTNNLSTFKHLQSPSTSATVSPVSHSRVSSMAGLKQIVNPSPHVNGSNSNNNTIAQWRPSFKGNQQQSNQPINLNHQHKSPNVSTSISSSNNNINKLNNLSTINLKPFDPAFFSAAVSPSSSSTTATLHQKESPIKQQLLPSENALIFLKQQQQSQFQSATKQGRNSSTPPTSASNVSSLLSPTTLQFNVQPTNQQIPPNSCSSGSSQQSNKAIISTATATPTTANTIGTSSLIAKRPKILTATAASSPTNQSRNAKKPQLFNLDATPLSTAQVSPTYKQPTSQKALTNQQQQFLLALAPAQSSIRRKQPAQAASLNNSNSQQQLLSKAIPAASSASNNSHNQESINRLINKHSSGHTAAGMQLLSPQLSVSQQELIKIIDDTRADDPQIEVPQVKNSKKSMQINAKNLVYLIQSKQPQPLMQNNYSGVFSNNNSSVNINQLNKNSKQTNVAPAGSTKNSKALSKTMSYSSHSNDLFYSPNSYTKQSIPSQQQQQSQQMIPQQQISAQKRIQQNQSYSGTTAVAMVDIQSHLQSLGFQDLTSTIQQQKEQQQVNKQKNVYSSLSSKKQSIAPLSAKQQASINPSGEFDLLLHRLDDFDATCVAGQPLDHVSEVLGELSLCLSENQLLAQIFDKLNANVIAIADETMRRYEELHSSVVEKQRTIDMLTEAITKNNHAINQGSSRRKLVESIQTQTTPKRQRRQQRNNNDQQSQIIQICDEQGNVQEVDTDKENEMLRDYILEQEKKVNQYKEKESEMIQLLQAVQKKGIDIDAIYMNEQNNKAQNLQNDDGVISSLKNKKPGGNHGVGDKGHDDDDGDSIEKTVPITKQKLQEMFHSAKRTRVDAKYFKSLDQDFGYADQSIVNDSDESSFGFYGKPNESMSASTLRQQKVKDAANNNQHNTNYGVSKKSGRGGSSGGQQRMFKLDLNNLKKFDDAEKGEVEENQTEQNNMEFQQFIMKKFNVTAKTLDQLSYLIQNDPNSLTEYQLDLIAGIHIAQQEYDRQHAVPQAASDHEQRKGIIGKSGEEGEGEELLVDDVTSNILGEVDL